MTHDPAQGGRLPSIKQLFSVDLLKLFPALARLLGFTRAGGKDSARVKGGQYGN
jgi:hypothetical protein